MVLVAVEPHISSPGKAGGISRRLINKTENWCVCFWLGTMAKGPRWNPVMLIRRPAKTKELDPSHRSRLWPKQPEA